MSSHMEWSSKIMRPCPFCNNKKTYCFVDLLERVQDQDGHPYYDAVIKCHKCGASVHQLHINIDIAVMLATKKWENRAGDA